MFKSSRQSGQIAIIILLIMIVLLTIGLSLATRTTQEVFLSQQEDESTRVFNAAESGVENALSQNFSGISAQTTLSDTNVVGDVTTTTTITPRGVLETQITQGTTVHLDLTGLAANAPITVEWSRERSCDNSASFIASIYYLDAGITKVSHQVFGPASPCSGERASDDFEQVSLDSGTDGYSYRYTFNLPANSLFLRLKSVYNDSPLRITGAESSNQFFVIRSEADNDLGNENRTIEVGRSLSTAPSFMDYAIYSGGELSQ